MKLCSSTFGLLTAAVVALAAAVPAQKGERGGSAEEMRRARAAAEQERGEEEKVDEGYEENLTPEERLSRSVTHGASAHCRFVADCKPRKLLPGQSGTMRVTALLQGNAVLPAPAPIELLPSKASGRISTGPLSVRPADAGRLAAAYLGRPVYDNFAIFEVPVTMSADVALGERHLVALDFKFDLYDGASAQPIGRFFDRVQLEIEVGSVPDPAVQAVKLNVSASPDQGTQDAQPTAATQERGDELVPRPAGIAGEAAAVAVPSEPADVEPPSASSTPFAPSPAADAGLPMPLLIGGGVGLLVLALLLLRRRR